MREIKFRAWDEKNKTMHNVWGLTQISVCLEEDAEFPPHYQKLSNGFKIMQSTGIKDKNGKEIYEGDVVMLDHWKSSDIFNYSKPFIVSYYEGEINFRQGDYNNFKGSLNGKLNIEVIGNIYENPELLENVSS